ncbi:outer membrane protein assembly factor BamE, partial [Verrucomicrobiota bacterium]
SGYEMKTSRIIFFLVLLALAGCATPTYVRNWRKVEFGMTKTEVRALLGQPHSISATLNKKPKLEIDGTNVPPENVSRALGDLVQALFNRSHEKWVYGKDSVAGTPEKVFVVYFDENGKVVAYRRPTKGEEVTTKHAKGAKED